MTLPWKASELQLQNALSGLAGIAGTSGGASYLVPPTVVIDPPSPGGIQATATCGLLVASANLAGGGSGYSFNPTAIVEGGGGSGATATCTIGDIQVAAAVLDSTGTYTGTPAVQFNGGDGSGASATANMGGGQVTAINLTATGTIGDPGTSPGITLGAPTGPNPRQALAHCQGWSINTPQVIIDDPGSGYTSAPAVSFTNGSGGNGAGATATTVVNNVGIQSLTLVSGGTGFDGLPPSISFVGGGAVTDATAHAEMTTALCTGITITASGSDFTSPPSIAIKGGQDPTGITATGTSTVSGGSVISVAMTLNGSKYYTAPFVIFVGGGGSGAVGRAVMSGGAVSSVSITSAGSGYTGAPDVLFVPSGGTGGSATAIMAVDPASFMLANPGYLYESVPNVTLTGGGPAGATPAQPATAVASLSPGLDDPLTSEVAQANLVALALVGAAYDEGKTVTVTTKPAVNYPSPAPVSWLEVDRATRFLATKLGMVWPATWDMLPSSDPGLVWTCRLPYFVQQVDPFGSDTVDPYVLNVWRPLYALAKANWTYLQATKLAPPQGSTYTTAYEDNSPLGLELQALMAQAAELAAGLMAA